MQPSYDISIEPSRSLLRLTLHGFFDTSLVERFVQERNAAVIQLNCGQNNHLTICDVRRQEISTPEVLGEFAKMIGDPRYASRRLAFVIGNALAGLQTKRIAARDNVAFFDNIASAETWLFSDYDRTQARSSLGEPITT